MQPAPPRPDVLVAGMGRIGPARRPEASARILAAVAGDAACAGSATPSAARTRRCARPASPSPAGWATRRRSSELSEATVLLHWSEWDGAPLAVLEAMARDVLVIASDIPANRELLGPRQVPSDEESAVATIRAVLRDPELREELLAEQRGRAAAGAPTAWRGGYVDLYERCVARHAPCSGGRAPPTGVPSNAHGAEGPSRHRGRSGAGSWSG